MATKRKKKVQDLHVLHPDAAGIDVGASEIFVAVPATATLSQCAVLQPLLEICTR
jgi:hypothetical protein